MAGISYWSSRTRRRLLILAGAASILAGATFAIWRAFAEIPPPNFYAGTTDQGPGRDNFVRLTCGSVVDAEIPEIFAPKRGATLSADSVCADARDAMRTQMLVAMSAGAAIGVALIVASARGKRPRQSHGIGSSSEGSA